MKTLYKGLAGLSLVSMMAATAANAAHLEIENAIAQANVPGSDNTVAYMTLNNRSEHDVRIIGVSSEIAKKTELHSHSMSNDRMVMRQVEYIDIDAGDKVYLAPNGYHVMFISLHQWIKPGEQTQITFEYDDGTEQEVALEVVDARTHNAKKHHHH
ncbi:MULTISPECIES: copper chaperone PCu(A)C [unclassified Vibrio]|uniref:Copper chaperone PCu(A)C n=1 Tax=Vibrio sp. HB236076 TaxID=3232307 RepID=A0AB39HGI0_9VIBR|nr:copper chaperone PCu(A)C [Vibrio sp. HB161653]MDP5255523.1 copper chaperone PCu(A)C [Vibrio sp. HB161653]